MIVQEKEATTLERLERGATVAQKFEIVIFVLLLFVAAFATDLSWSDRATLTIAFATISGVFLGLWFVVKNQKPKQNRHVTLFLLTSILVSLISSIDSLDRTNSPFSSKYTIWLVSVVVFGFSSAYFAVQSEVFGETELKESPTSVTSTTSAAATETETSIAKESDPLFELIKSVDRAYHTTYHPNPSWSFIFKVWSPFLPIFLFMMGLVVLLSLLTFFIQLGNELFPLSVSLSSLAVAVFALLLSWVPTFRRRALHKQENFLLSLIDLKEKSDILIVRGLIRMRLNSDEVDLIDLYQLNADLFNQEAILKPLVSSSD